MGKGITTENTKSGFWACWIYPLNPVQIPEEAYLPSTLYSVNSASTAVVIAEKQNEQIGTSQPEAEENERVASIGICQVTGVAVKQTMQTPASLTALAVKQAGVCIVCIIQQPASNISTISVSFDQVATEPDQPRNTTGDNIPGEQPCPPDLALYAIQLSITPDKLNQSVESSI